MGVITVTDIDYGHIFGPYPSHVTPADPAYLIGMLTNDKRPEGFMLKMDPQSTREGLRAVDWLPYIQPARDSEEQNMEAYLKEGQVYFRALRIIKAGEEMFVWYSKDFAQLLTIPELPRTNLKEGDHYICPRCGETFEFPYSLRAHIKFKCSYTLQELHPNRIMLPRPDFRNGLHSDGGERAFKAFRAFNQRTSTDTGRNPSPKDSQLNGLDFSRATMNGLDFSISHNTGLDFSKSRSSSGGGLNFSKSLNENSSADVSAAKADIRASHVSPCSSTLASPSSSSSSKSESGPESCHSSSARHQNGAEFSKPFPHFSEGRKSSLSPPSTSSPPKRPSSGDHSPASSPKMLRPAEPKPEMLSPGRDFSRMDRSPGRIGIENIGLKGSHGEVTSAFRKVERSVTPEADRPSSGGSSSRAEDNSSLSPVDVSSGGGCGVSMSRSSLPPHSVHPAISSMSRFPMPGGPVTSMPGPLMGLYMPRLPMVPPTLGLPGAPHFPVSTVPLHAITAHHPAFAAADQIPPGLLEMCRATIPSIGPLTESLANIRNGDGPGAEFPLKPGMFLGDRSGGGHPSLGGGMGPGSVPFMKSNNPMVEKILQSTSPAMMTSPMTANNMSQNWCAKCNATFRMTSDLVYHMRSHHKREFDPMKRKREEKLKCTICNEMFRERHHLTRHMSSHA